MAVVVNNYIPRDKHAFIKAKKTLLYNEIREGKDKEKIILDLFNRDGKRSEAQAIQFLESKPKGWYYWRFMISPDPGEMEDGQKDLDMRELTRKTIDAIETYLGMEGQIDFVAAIHTDRHHRHAHTIIYLPRLTREQFATLAYLPREKATEEALFQRQSRDLSVQRVQENTRSTELKADHFPDVRKMVGIAGGRANHFVDANKKIGRIRKAKELTPPCPNGRGHAVVKWKGKDWCQNCEEVLEQSMGLGL